MKTFLCVGRFREIITSSSIDCKWASYKHIVPGSILSTVICELRGVSECEGSRRLSNTAQFCFPRRLLLKKLSTDYVKCFVTICFVTVFVRNTVVPVFQNP